MLKVRLVLLSHATLDSIQASLLLAQTFGDSLPLLSKQTNPTCCWLSYQDSSSVLDRLTRPYRYSLSGRQLAVIRAYRTTRTRML